MGLRAGGSAEAGPWVGAWWVEVLYPVDLYTKAVVLHLSDQNLFFFFGHRLSVGVDSRCEAPVSCSLCRLTTGVYRVPAESDSRVHHDCPDLDFLPERYKFHQFTQLGFEGFYPLLRIRKRAISSSTIVSDVDFRKGITNEARGYRRFSECPADRREVV